MPETAELEQHSKMDKVAVGAGVGGGVASGGYSIGTQDYSQAGLEAAGSATSAAAGLGGGAVSAGMGAKSILDGRKKKKSAGRADDAAMDKIGSAEISAGAVGIGKGAASATKGGLAIAQTAATATGVGSVLTGAVGAVEGTVGAVSAGKKLDKASKASKGLLTGDGKRWMARVQNREKWIAASNTLKAVAGVVGIVGGALLLASNPVGWGIAIGAAAVGTGIVIAKGVNSLYKYFKSKKKAAKALEKAHKGDGTFELDNLETKAIEGLTPAEVDDEMAAAESESEDDAGGSSAAKMGDSKKAQAQAKEFQKIVADNHAVATEMSAAVKAGNGIHAHDDDATDDDKRNFDAGLVLGVLGINPLEAGSKSGIDLIVKKMSVAENV